MKYFCRGCSGHRNHKVLFEKKKTGSDEEYDFYWTDRYLVIECLGCENISFLHSYGNSEMVEQYENGDLHNYTEDNVYPPYLEYGVEIERQYYLPKNIETIYRETMLAFKLKSYILTAGGFRAIIEATCNHLNIKKKNLLDRIDLLSTGGFLTQKESRRLHTIRFLGNDALHEIEVPKEDQLLIILDIINHLLENLFIHDKLINGLDSIIDEYSNFIKLIEDHISKDMIGKELKLKDILGKSYRRIKANDLKEFVLILKQNIDQGAFDLMSYRVQKNQILFSILKTPRFVRVL